ncbi:hypothetical protein SAMN04488109_3360 [Chryseolinea serpens]|uniref:Uncharacterized protein n=1 Tax=Chryseolinea serpens TaxID=947013 RepID=A0A1M5RF54_9BACT|nr:hypothetical protein SAMN04488109_3360 [Chryseolinea serpens]
MRPPLLMLFTNNIPGGVLYLYLPFANTSLQQDVPPRQLVGEEHQQGRGNTNKGGVLMSPAAKNSQRVNVVDVGS